MNVVVAEKPSVARDLAVVLGAKQRKEGYYEGNDWRVTWALGHLATLKTPDEYDPALKRWSLDRLPFVPERFELKPSGDRGQRQQLDIVAELCRDADELVCATDAGREGELIFRYILEYAGCADRSHSRLWLSSLTEQAIEKGLATRKPGSEYERLHAAARSRSEADWIVGLNATRAYTVRYGAGSVLWSVGRVQTPVLALIALRDDEIRVFDARPFWELRTRYREARFKFTGERFREREPCRSAAAAGQRPAAGHRAHREEARVAAAAAALRPDPAAARHELAPRHVGSAHAAGRPGSLREEAADLSTNRQPPPVGRHGRADSRDPWPTQAVAARDAGPARRARRRCT